MCNRATTENKPTRVVLGPVARQLIEGKGQNGQQALEDAIQELQERARQTEYRGEDPALTAFTLTALEAATDRSIEAMNRLATTTAKELKLTRILIASLMTSKSEEQQQLIEMTEQIIQDLHKSGTLLEVSELEKLNELDARYKEITSRELQRGAELPHEVREQVQEEELER